MFWFSLEFMILYKYETEDFSFFGGSDVGGGGVERGGV